jgi:hypothetical protein
MHACLNDYFCRMSRLILFLWITPLLSLGQVRLAKLEVKRGEIYKISAGDILVIDTLIMSDSSSIELNYLQKDNYIHAKVLVAGTGTRILGRGEGGKPGKDGAKGFTPDGPCLDGTAGRGGTGGTHGDDGKNLFLYLTTLNIQGSLLIDLSGGDGGDGGKGGLGGGGSPGTRVCVGGTGGTGGNGSTGGNGGGGGTLTVNCKSCPDLRLWLGEKLVVRNFGGYAGLGGDGGQGGPAGLSSVGDNAKDGKAGPRGKKGANGEAGKQGAINFGYN